MARIDAIRQISITEQTYYRWRKQYGAMGTSQLKELRRLHQILAKSKQKIGMRPLQLSLSKSTYTL